MVGTYESWQSLWIVTSDNMVMIIFDMNHLLHNSSINLIDHTNDIYQEQMLCFKKDDKIMHNNHILSSVYNKWRFDILDTCINYN